MEGWRDEWRDEWKDGGMSGGEEDTSGRDVLKVLMR